MTDLKALQHTLDAQLSESLQTGAGLPHVVAVATDRGRRLYAGAAGPRVLGEPETMTVDTVLAMFSVTKPLASTVCLQLVEENHLDLDRPAKAYVPELGTLQVLEGFDEDGQPRLRAPKRDITTRMLLLHTAGFGYEFFDAHYRRLIKDRRFPSTITGKKAALMTPLLFDPGEQWLYGSSLDWVGVIIERITGQKLDAAMRRRLFDPLGMTSTSFRIAPDMRRRLARVHQRTDDSLLPLTDYELPQDPEIQMAGHGLYSTAEDFTRFIQMWLNDGQGPSGTVLKPQTVAWASKNGLSGKKIRKLTSTNARVTRDFELFEGIPKSWALSFMVNDLDAPTGRAAGSLSWAGLGNLYFWIDPKNRVGGIWATQLFPFGDPFAVNASLSFEKTIYDFLEH